MSVHKTHGFPAATGLYDPQNEKDSCGVGFVAHIKGERSHQIIKDADLSTVGSKNFKDFSERLRKEWKIFCKEDYTDIDWYQSNIDFLNNHQFQTEKAQELFGEIKKTNLKKMKNL